jgi:hypothetical protein
MKIRMKFANIAIAMATLFTGSAVMAATLNIPYSAGYVRAECADSKQGGVRLEINPSQPNESCWVDVPVALDAGRTIEQVSIFYGNDGAHADLHAYVGFKDLRAGAINDSFEGVELFQYASTTNAPQNGMAAGNLMSQAQTGVTYPDAFEMDPNYSYFVRVMLRKDSEFFGVRVTYR